MWASQVRSPLEVPLWRQVRAASRPWSRRRSPARRRPSRPTSPSPTPGGGPPGAPAVAPPRRRVLEVATGPGYVALGLAAVPRGGGDRPDARPAGHRGGAAPRARADQRPLPGGRRGAPALRRRGVRRRGCRLAFHHFADPARVLDEMVRVCRPGGTVAVEDLVVSEHPARLPTRTASSTCATPRTPVPSPSAGSLAAFTGRRAGGGGGADLGAGAGGRSAGWPTPRPRPDPAAEVRRLIEADGADDLSGARPFRRDPDGWCFRHRNAIVVGRKLRAALTGPACIPVRNDVALRPGVVGRPAGGTAGGRGRPPSGRAGCTSSAGSPA